MRKVSSVVHCNTPQCIPEGQRQRPDVVEYSGTVGIIMCVSMTWYVCCLWVSGED